MANKILVIIMLQLLTAQADDDMTRLFKQLFETNGYNRIIRPVNNHTTGRLTIRIGLSLSQLIDLDERNQIFTSMLWLKHTWVDDRMTWNPADFGGTVKIRLPADLLWLPDIVLYNSADGNYDIQIMGKATLFHDGTIWWEPPAIFRSICEINIEFFPFDEQSCTLKFGSWTYDWYQLNLVHMLAADEGPGTIPEAIDLDDYYESGEWDLLAVPAARNDRYYHCCSEPYTDVTFTIKIRRKTLFYTVNMLFPCIVMAFLSIFAFYLPAGSKQKVNMGASILVSLTLFVLLLNEIMPPTSRVIPLMAKYLLFTLILLTLSIILSVVVLNIHFFAFRTMSPWVRTVFLVILPKILGMKIYTDDERFCSSIFDPDAAAFVGTLTGTGIDQDDSEYAICEPPSTNDIKFQRRSSLGTGTMTPLEEHDSGITSLSNRRSEVLCASGPHRNIAASYNKTQPGFNFLVAALNDVDYVAKRLKSQTLIRIKHDEWRYVARVVDRLLLWIFAAACISGSCAIIFQAHTLFDSRPVLRGKL